MIINLINNNLIFCSTPLYKRYQGCVNGVDALKFDALRLVNNVKSVKNPLTL